MAKGLFEQARQKDSSEQEQAELLTTQTLERIDIELDGILARLRRGSVPMAEKEQKRKGDVYREIKVGAVFRAERGRERSELAPGRLGWRRPKLAVCPSASPNEVLGHVLQ